VTNIVYSSSSWMWNIPHHSVKKGSAASWYRMLRQVAWRKTRRKIDRTDRTWRISWWWTSGSYSLRFIKFHYSNSWTKREWKWAYIEVLKRSTNNVVTLMDPSHLWIQSLFNTTGDLLTGHQWVPTMTLSNTYYLMHLFKFSSFIPLDRV